MTQPPRKPPVLDVGRLTVATYGRHSVRFEWDGITWLGYRNSADGRVVLFTTQRITNWQHRRAERISRELFLRLDKALVCAVGNA